MAFRPKVGETEVVKLNKKNIKYIARRSGQPEDALREALDVMKAQGREPKMRYQVVAD